MKYDIFKTDKEKLEARKALPELLEHPGWKVIIKALDSNIVFLTDELKEKNFDDLLPVALRQKQIIHLEELKNLPATIIDAAQDDPEQEDDSIYE